MTYELQEQENLTKRSLAKPLAHAEDLTLLLARLYSTEYLNTFPIMRNVLKITLFVNLIIDIGGRGGEIALVGSRPEHRVLRWDDVEFYTFQSDQDSDFDISARIKIRWSKGHSMDESLYKYAVFSNLMPAHMATQDTLRLLLITAVMDGVLDNVQQWDDLLQFRLPADLAKTGQRLRMKEGMGTVPVLRLVDENHSLTRRPARVEYLQKQLLRLGVFCGFQGRLSAYAFRRGVAYTLASNPTVDDEMRRHIMGHKSRDPTWYAYQSKVFTVDVPKLYRAQKTTRVLQLGAISLNRSHSAPQTISAEGRLEAQLRQDVTETLNAREKIRAEILAKHKSLGAAEKSGDDLWKSFTVAHNAYHIAKRAAEREIFRKEYQSHFDRRLEAFGKLDVVQATRPQNGQPAQQLKETQQDDGQQLEKDLRDFGLADDSDIGVDMADALLGSVAETSSDDTGPVDNTPTDSTSSAMRLHGVPTDGGRNGRGVQRQGIKGLSAYQDMQQEMDDVGEDSSALANIMTRWFSIIHGLDDFRLGEEPLPGTFLCRFFGMGLEQAKSPTKHASECAMREAVKEGTRLLGKLSPVSQVCQFVSCGSGVDRGTFIQCGEGFSTQKDKAQHARAHLRKMEKTLDDGQKVLLCYFGNCAVNPGSRKKREGTVFTSEEERLMHLWDVHRISTFASPQVRYCELCGTWLTAPYEWRGHAQTHLDDVEATIKEFGFGGVVAGRQIVPRFCPFCYKNPAKPIFDQLRAFDRLLHHRNHIVSHLLEIKERELRVTCPCYPRLCSSSVKMTAVEVMTHLAEEHQVPALAKMNEDFVHQKKVYAKRQRRTDEEEVADSNDSDSDVKPPAKKQSVTKRRDGGKKEAQGTALGEVLDDVE